MSKVLSKKSEKYLRDFQESTYFSNFSYFVIITFKEPFMPSIILSILQIDLHCSGWICSQKTFRKYFWDIFVWDKIRDKKHINVLIERSLLVQEGPLKFFGLELQQWLHYGILAYTTYIGTLIECLFYVYFGLWCCGKYKESTWPFQSFHNPIWYKASKKRGWK